MHDPQHGPPDGHAPPSRPAPDSLVADGGRDAGDDDLTDSIPTDWRRVDDARQFVTDSEQATFRGPNVIRDHDDREGEGIYYSTAALEYDRPVQQWVATVAYVNADTFDREEVSTYTAGEHAMARRWLASVLADWRDWLVDDTVEDATVDVGVRPGRQTTEREPRAAGARNPRHREWRDRAERKGWELTADDYPNQQLTLAGREQIDDNGTEVIVLIEVDGTRDLAYRIRTMLPDGSDDYVWTSTTYPTFDDARGMALLEGAEAGPAELARSVWDGGSPGGRSGGGRR